MSPTTHALVDYWHELPSLSSADRRRALEAAARAVRAGFRPASALLPAALGDPDADVVRRATAHYVSSFGAASADGRLGEIQFQDETAGQWGSVAAIRVVGVDQPVNEDLFVIGETLTEDGRVGKVTDAEGITAVRPVMGERWTPLDAGTLVMPGDWLRTDPRGANAAAARLVKDTHVTLGPGTLVEPARLCLSPGLQVGGRASR